jgi:hypothetical protein
MKVTKKRTFPLTQVYRLLEPGPVVLVTTARAGMANIMTLSWHTMMEFEPSLVGCVISNRNYTFTFSKTAFSPWVRIHRYPFWAASRIPVVSESLET